MMSAERYQFGDITVDLRRLEVRRAGELVFLEPKAFDVLRYLIEHRDRLVLKDELLDVAWKDTFVTPNALTRIIALLRKGLGDDVSEARYIETVVKRGYRFIAPVVVTEAGTNTLTATATPAPPFDRLSAARAWPGATRLALSAFVAVVGIGAASLWLIFREPDLTTGDASAFSLRRLTVEPDSYAYPTLSFDGRTIAYASSRTGMAEIYSAGLALGSRTIPITTDGGNVQPAFSPDGQWLAYHSRKRGGVWVVPATGGMPRQVAPVGSMPSWAPDSLRIVFTSDTGGMSAQAVLWMTDRDGAPPTPVTRLGNPPGGHLAPAWSHDGRLIAFSVGGRLRREIWVVDSNGHRTRRVATDALQLTPQFSPRADAVYWIGRTAEGNDCLMRITLDSDGDPVGEPRIVSCFPGHTSGGLALARDGTAIVSLDRITSNLFAIDLEGQDTIADPIQLTHDDARNMYPVYGPAGRVVYQQEVAGHPITSWLMDEDGRNKEPLSAGLSASVRLPQWHAHGERALAVVSETPASQAQLAWIDLATRRLTRPAALAVGSSRTGPPSVSPDGRQIAFHVIGPDGVINVWIQRLDDGSQRQITFDREAITFPRWSSDGRWLAVTIKRGDRTHVGIVSPSGGEVEQLTFESGQSWPYSFAPKSESIAFGGERDGVWNIYAISRKTRRITQLTRFTTDNGDARFPAWSPHGSRIVFVRTQSAASLWTMKLPF